MRRERRLYGLNITAVLVVLLILAACAGGGAVTQNAQTEHYSVQLSLDGVGFGAREATIDVRDAAGKPVAADEIVLAPVMRQMGMAAPEATAQPLAPGRYRATGDFFSMIGEWEINVRVRAGGGEEVATFKVQSTQ
jgi:YtkA-like